MTVDKVRAKFIGCVVGHLAACANHIGQCASQRGAGMAINGKW